MAATERHIFFETTLQLLGTTANTDYDTLCQTANEVANGVASFAVPVPTAQPFEANSIDYDSLALIPPDAPSNLIPLLTTSNGNCFYNAVSILLSGNELLATELRVRTALALIQLCDHFTSKQSIQNLMTEQISLYSAFATTDYNLHSTDLSRDEVITVLQNEVRSTLEDNAWACMWQVQALATTLEMCILSIYPNFNQRIRPLFNKAIVPLFPYGNDIDLLPIMWSGYVTDNNQFHSNHFVPLVTASRIIGQSLPSTTSFVTVGKKQIDTETPLHSKETFVVETSPCSDDKIKNADVSNTLKSLGEYHCLQSLPKSVCHCCGQLILCQKVKLFSVSGVRKPTCHLCYCDLSKSIPPRLSTNSIGPGKIPPQLQQLTTTEVHLVSQIHPFMTLLKLPSGGQYAAKGQSINIPIPFQEVASQLPRSIRDEPFISVKSSTKSTKSHIVSTANIQSALSWLHTHNHLYAHIRIESDLENNTQTEQIHKNEQDLKNIPTSVSMSDDESWQDISFIPNDYNVPISSTKDAVNSIPSYTLPILREKPISIFSHPTAEELAFPHLFPYGINGMKSLSSVTPKQYFICRLLNNDKRWATCLPYLFWALNVYEQYKLQSCISVAVRLKSSAEHSLQAQHIVSGSFENKVAEDYKFMKNMKGTSAYWHEQLHNLLAKMNILGPPTFFLSLSSNDSNWLELYQFVHPELDENDVQQLNSTQRSQILRDNPIKSALYFSKRWETFLRTFLLGKSQPLGEILDYFARIEFQNRGSPHVHAFFWVQGAPDMETLVGRQTGIGFIDKYICAQLPAESDPMYMRVKLLQQHAHTHTCYKTSTSTSCRFDFPRPPSETTQIQLSNISATTGRFYTLARSPQSVWINPYNVSILQQWNANMDLQLVGCKFSAAAYVCTYVCKNEPVSLKRELANTIQKLPTNASARSRLSKIGNILLTHRTISSQEAVFRILDIPMVYSSRTTIYINTNPPMKRFRKLKPKALLKTLSPQSCDVFEQNVHDIYARRPKTATFENMSLAKFATSYTVLNKNDKIISNSRCTRSKLIGTPVQWIRERTKQACFRTYMPRVTVDSAGYFYSILCLFLPWRSDDDILHPYKTCEDAFLKKSEFIDHLSLEQFHYTEKVLSAANYILQLREECQRDIQCVATPAFMSDQIDDGIKNEQLIEPTFQFANHADVEEQSSDGAYPMEEFTGFAEKTMTDLEYTNCLQKCTREQTQVIELIDARFTADILETQPLHLFITGGAGCGKSFLLQLVREHILRRNTCNFPNVLVAAPTGVAAFNIHGWTLHRLLKLDVQHKNKAEYTPIAAKQLHHLRKLFVNVKFLIIDEISMVSVHTLTHIHRRLTEIKDTLGKDGIFFGNLNIIAFGDLYQLRPVYGRYIFADHIDMPTIHLWRDLFYFLELSQNIRQQGDTIYATILNRIRNGKQTNEDIQFLMTRCSHSSTCITDAQYIFPTRQQCAAHNMQCLLQSSRDGSTLYQIEAVHDPKDTEIPDDDTFCGGLPKIITASVGARVMLLRNIETSAGLVNGAQGTVVGFKWSTKEGQQYSGQLPVSIDVLFDDPSVGAVFHENVHSPISIKPITVSFYNSARTTVSRTQFPLAVSYAVTVHKVQGLTLPKAAIDIGSKIFTAGMAYVALSRVSSSSGLSLLDLDPRKIYASVTVIEEMNRLSTTCAYPL